MSFSNTIKEEVRRKAAFRCCRCENLGSVEAHHIIPEFQGGLDTFDNAAPLCPTCHAEFGGNPDKRKEIKQKRDWWYEKMEIKYGQFPDFSMIEEIKQGLEEVQKNQLTLEKFKETLKNYAVIAIDSMTLGTLASGATGIAEATAASFSPSPSPFMEDKPLPKTIEGTGGDGGIIMVMAQNLSGSGKIIADGGQGLVGGKGGNIRIQSEKNSFSGTISATGGNSIDKPIKEK